MLDFASDNYAPAHPDVLAAVAEANAGHAVSYGEDPWSARAQELLRAEFGPESHALLVFNGSAANVTCLRTLCAPWEAVVCAQTAHIATDEGGAPEASAGLKLLTCPTPDGKLTPDLVLPWLAGIGDVHSAQPRVVSVTETTEVGTRYSVEELRALGEFCADSGLLLHVDGARLANAAAGLDVGLGDLAAAAGAAAVSFGGTKNGALGVEAAVFLRPVDSRGGEFVRKQHLQLASKHRFLAAQFVALLTDDLWRRLAAHANSMAARLAAAVADLPGVEITQAVEANGLFVRLPEGVADALREDFRFYVWDPATGVQRWMCAWDTTADQVDEFAAAVRLRCEKGAGS